MHQTWLEYGPHMHRLESANAAVRQCLSDMGTEYGVADAVNVTHVCAHHAPPHRTSTDHWLYPNAMKVPGSQHILDTILQDGLQRVCWWPVWEAHAKSVCQWVHKKPRREFLQARLIRCEEDVVRTLDAGCEKFADWRWKTLGQVVRDLRRMETALRHATVALSTSDLGTRDSVQSQMFLEAVHSQAFWTRTKALETLAKPFIQFSSWLRGCDCHDREGIDNCLHTCDWKGCRAPDMSSRVRLFMDELAQNRANQDVADDADTHGAMTRMLAVADLKFSWVNELPFYIWQVNSRSTASEFLSKYDAVRTRHDRVSERFGTGHLRIEMDRWSRGGQKSELLRMELLSYAWCKVDDTWAEACHRDASRDGSRTTHASQAWVSASFRLRQNLHLYDSLGTTLRSQFCTMLRHWKAIAQTTARRAVALRRRKLQPKNIVQFVYRSGADALEDWGGKLHEALMSCTRAETVLHLSFAGRLKVDYLDKVLVPGHIFSLPRVPKSCTLRAIAEAPMVDADESLHGISESIMYFMVVETRLRRRKVARTEVSRARQHMLFPMSIQEYEPMPGSTEACERVSLRPHGLPLVRDLHDMASWLLWRGALREYTVSVGVHPGTVQAGSAVPVSLRRWDLSHVDTPALVVLDKLVEDGWHVGSPPPVHTATSDKVFAKADNLSAKPYWQCLATLDNLFQKGLVELLPGMPHNYYSNILLAEMPQQVVPVCPTATSTHFSVGTTTMCKVATSVSGATGARSSVSKDDCDEDMPMATHISPRMPSSSVSSCPGRKRAPDVDVLSSAVQDGASEDPLWHALPHTVRASGGGGQAVTIAPSADSLAGVVDFIEGQPVRVEERGVEGAIGHYRRFVVTCPLHCEPGKAPCRARRNTGARQTALLGINEPLAYLGAWLVAGPDFATRAAHVAFKASHEETRDYAVSRHML